MNNKGTKTPSWDLKTRNRAEAATQALLVRVQGARFGLDALHKELLYRVVDARERLKTNHDDATALEVLPYAYSELPRIRVEVDLLSEGRLEDRQAWLEADGEGRREMADRILRVGRLPRDDGTTAEVEY